jgi:hypothetical protein
MATNNPRGFVPLRTLRGDSNFRTKRFSVSANNPFTLLVGDPVVLQNGHVRRVDTSGVSAGEPGVLGVIGGVYNSNGRPFTHNLPNSPNAIPASTAGFVDVYSDPDIVYLVNADSAANQAQMGQLVRVTAGPANTAAGISGFQIKMVDATNRSFGHQYQIIGIGPNETIDSTESQALGAGQDLEVLISDHQYRRSQVVLAAATAAVG